MNIHITDETIKKRNEVICHKIFRVIFTASNNVRTHGGALEVGGPGLL